MASNCSTSTLYPTYVDVFEMERLDDTLVNFRLGYCPPIYLPKQDCSYGDVVWARFSKIVWPGMIFHHSLANLSEPKKGFLWVFWFGDNMVSQVMNKSISRLSVNFEKRCHASKSQIFKAGVHIALQVCAERAEVVNGDHQGDNLWTWAATTFPTLPQQTFTPDTAHMYPDFVLRVLQRMAATAGSSTDISDKRDSDNKNGGNIDDTSNHNIDDDDDDNSDNNSDDNSDDKDEENENQADSSTDSNEVDSGSDMDTDSDDDLCDQDGRGFCVACFRVRDLVSEHPLYKGSLCRTCKVRLKDRLFRLDNDCCSMYCCVCAKGGELFVCDNTDCRRAHCTPCLSQYLPTGNVLKQIRQSSQWMCFLCNDVNRRHFLRPHNNWKERLVIFSGEVIAKDLSYLSSSTKRRLRVLSVCDGIGSGKLILDQLGLDVEVYYSLETNTDALAVSKVNHGTAITQVGGFDDVWGAYNTAEIKKLLQPTQLMSLCPLDLVLGKLPFDVPHDETNWLRTGFGGHGFWFARFDQLRINVEIMSKEKSHVFWMLENTVAMESEITKEACLMLQGWPAMWKVKDKVKYYWGNIPGLYGSRKKHLVIKLPDEQQQNRRTEKNGNTEGETHLAVQNNADGQNVDRAYGFPANYTAVEGLSVDRRQKLLAQAWDLTTARQLLRPLREFFKAKD